MTQKQQHTMALAVASTRDRAAAADGLNQKLDLRWRDVGDDGSDEPEAGVPVSRIVTPRRRRRPEGVSGSSAPEANDEEPVKLCTSDATSMSACEGPCELLVLPLPPAEVPRAVPLAALVVLVLPFPAAGPRLACSAHMPSSLAAIHCVM